MAHLRCGTKGGSMLRIVFQSTPEKKGWFLTSSDEFLPSRFSGSRIMLRVCAGNLVSLFHGKMTWRRRERTS